DDFTWDPPSIEIAVGETVTLRVTNEGAIPHDFLLGDEHMQDDHEEEMQSGMAHMGDEPNAFVLDPDQTKEMTWTFTAAGELLYGCHQPGHYGAGMVGTITVQ
ncbi:MAG TPA: plastocyanin/azurin family copper-binding protein, partial [Candidatus Limnocylindrales bacterium]|nr:plastocyanin/azurin family copper-binding protein [Candidatus Limnocylindrales bacterium]